MNAALDVVIIGGGPSGLSAALLLGRCRRRVVVCDDGHPRNGCSKAVHGFFTRDGIDPHELLNIGRAQLAPYGVEVRETKVTNLSPLPAKRGEGQGEGPSLFQVTLSTGERLHSRTLLLATGLKDDLPRVTGLDALYGRSVFHCPYCDAWEFRDRRLVVYGHGHEGAEYALGLTTWSADVTLCTDGVRRMPEEDAAALTRRGIPIRAEKIQRLDGDDGRLRRVVFDTGASLDCDALFFEAQTAQRSDLALQLGCEFTAKGSIRTETGESTTVPGLYAVGDATHDVNFVSVAVAEGTKAGVAINKALRREA